jgi:isochorismate synthase
MQPTNSVKAATVNELEQLSFLISHHLAEGNAVALWRAPNSNEKQLLICATGVKEIDDLQVEETETGFVFAPFDTARKKTFFKGDLIYSFKEGELKEGAVTDICSENVLQVGMDMLPRKRESVSINHDPTSGDHYKDLVQKSISHIKAGTTDKIVPTRFKEIELNEDFDCVAVFQKLCAVYPAAFVSFVSSEETGSWIGATPELLVSLDAKEHFKTVALAGTKRSRSGMNIKSVAWTEKEIEEQALVCRYIISCFKKIRLREYEERGPRTVTAGNVVHLKTEFEVDTVSTNFPLLTSVMLKLLHPTSAVCGMPLENAQQFLKANEGYDREYYTGFLGPVNVKNESHLFVNLRCMQVLTKSALLYAGAGVTIDSDPQKEFEETELKMEAILNIIK